MTDEFDGLLWAYRAVFKQTDVGGGTVNVNVIATERTVFLWGMIGPDDYAAGRSIKVYIMDADDNIIGQATEGLSVDNTRFTIPQTGMGASSTVDAVNEFNQRIVLGRGERLFVLASSFAQNEELTLAMRALIGQSSPTVTTTGSAGTVTTTTDYDKVI